MQDIERPKYRKIIHIDMDAFYAAVEQRDFEQLRGKPVIVGGSPRGRGVVATASYEARQFGVRSAMSSAMAEKLCPHGIFVYPRFHVYKEVSSHIRAIFRRYTDLIEPLSLDEAYLDVTVDKLGIGSALQIAQEIKNAIKIELNLTASAGVSINKFVAKIASDMNKPDGLTFIGPSKINRFMERLPVEKFYGVGKVTADRMRKQHLKTGGDLKKLSEQRLMLLFGKSGKFYYRIVRGIDNRPVKPYHEAKSISSEDTFYSNLSRGEELNNHLAQIAQTTFERLKKHHLYGRTLTLKVKFEDFKLVTRSQTNAQAIVDLVDAIGVAQRLLDGIDFGAKQVRLLGLGFSNFYDHRQDTGDIQSSLF